MMNFMFPNDFDDDTYAEDYGHLGNFWDDAKTAAGSIFNAAVSILRPAAQQVAPQLVYKAVTGQQMPVQQAGSGQAQPQVVVMQPGLPSWLLPVAAAAAVLFLVMQLKRKA